MTEETFCRTQHSLLTKHFCFLRSFMSVKNGRRFLENDDVSGPRILGKREKWTFSRSFTSDHHHYISHHDLDDVLLLHVHVLSADFSMVCCSSYVLVSWLTHFVHLFLFFLVSEPFSVFHDDCYFFQRHGLMFPLTAIDSDANVKITHVLVSPFESCPHHLPDPDPHDGHLQGPECNMPKRVTWRSGRRGVNGWSSRQWIRVRVATLIRSIWNSRPHPLEMWRPAFHPPRPLREEGSTPPLIHHHQQDIFTIFYISLHQRQHLRRCRTSLGPEKADFVDRWW